MSEELSGTGEVYDGETYMGDIVFNIKGDEGTVMPLEDKDSVPMHRALVEDRKTLTLRYKGGELLFRFGGEESVRSVGEGATASWSIMVERTE